MGDAVYEQYIFISKGKILMSKWRRFFLSITAIKNSIFCSEIAKMVISFVTTDLTKLLQFSVRSSGNDFLH